MLRPLAINTSQISFLFSLVYPLSLLLFFGYFIFSKFELFFTFHSMTIYVTDQFHPPRIQTLLDLLTKFYLQFTKLSLQSML
jgi:hypothetical protein